MTDDRRYLITGAASGIGRSTAEIAAASGASLALVDRNEEKLSETADTLRQRGANVTTILSDVSQPTEPARIVAEATAFLGGLDVVVSNAGAPVFSPLKDLDIEAFDAAMALNVRATWLLAKAAYPWLVESRGNIVATGSMCGHFPAPPQGAYSVAKAGLLMLVQQLALEWGPDGIRVNSVSPGPTTTGLTEGVFNDRSDPKQRAIIELREANLPLRKIGSPDEVAHAILFLASREASQITGIDVKVDGGMATVLMLAAGVAAGRT